MFRQKLSMIPDTVKLNCDATSIKGFISYLVRRHNGAKRRVNWLVCYRLD